jgi:hypothetical protein
MQEQDFSEVLCAALSWLQIDKMNTLSQLFFMPSDSIQNIIHDLDEHIQDVSPKEAFLILKYLNTIVKNNWIIYNVTVRRRLWAYRTGAWYFELWDFMVQNTMHTNAKILRFQDRFFHQTLLEFVLDYFREKWRAFFLWKCFYTEDFTYSIFQDSFAS